MGVAVRARGPTIFGVIAGAAGSEFHDVIDLDGGAQAAGTANLAAILVADIGRVRVQPGEQRCPRSEGF